MIVKICGITRPADARLAVSLGATHVGVICWPGSPRYVEPAAAAAIVEAVGGRALTVGVFVDEAPERMNELAAETGFDLLQLHGQEAPQIGPLLSRPYIKALAVGPELDAGLAHWPGVPVLLDAHDPVRRGGTGAVVDWDRAAVVARTREVILAGGLRPENVGDALSRVRPAGVDVSSGVESAPGVKDEERLRALFDAIRRVEELS
ncbi:MAG TPA: phosphoribosylanthranilate isomerase [Vicinamibacterales bacterium]